jgi:hypothetical protein
MSVELLNGFTNLKDVVNERVTGDLIPAVTDAIDQSIAEHNKMTDDMISLFVHKTTDFKVRYKSPAAAKLQPLDEHGRARKIKAAGYYDIGLPLRDAGTALGDTRIALVKKTVKEVNDDIALILQADQRWLRDQILSALYYNVNYTFSDAEHGDLLVKALANQDGTLYLVKAGAEAGTESQNYRGITALDDANNPFATIHRDLTSRPENFGGGRVITFLPTNLEDEAMNLTDFIEETDPDIALGDNVSRLTGSLDASVPGEVIGKSGRNWLVRWDALPDNYMISLITSGARPLAMREHPEAELQGFNRVAERNDDPYYESQYTRHAGFGGWNRVAAIITKVGAASYTSTPTDFSAPFSVS